MFQRPFTVRSDTSIRNSDKKKLLARLPPINGISSKTMVSLMHVKCYKGEDADVYTFEKEPLLFTVMGEEVLYPTVYLTWKIPDAFPVLVINEFVYQKLLQGADLFLQGVIRPLRQTLEFGSHAAVAISVLTSSKQLRGPVAVGYSLMSSMQMIANGMQGPGVRLLHFYGDLLWGVGTHEKPLEISAERMNLADTLPGSYETEFPSLGSLVLDEKPSEVHVEGSSFDTALDDKSKNNGLINASEEQAEEELKNFDTAETLLERCFLAALKYRVTKKGQLPLDVGEFYSHFLLPCLPSGRRIDMKKTVYKKFSVFLEHINKSGSEPIVKLIINKNKGSGMITEINWMHPFLKDFEITDEKIDDIKTEKMLIKVDDYLAVTEPVSAIFRNKCGKSDLMEKVQVRQIITSYVKNMNPTIEGKLVIPNDSVLVSLLGSRESVDWNTLFQKIISKMTKTYVITWADGRQLVRKTTLPKITFKIENRAGNKKVTLVNNLSIYGIDPKKLCREIQTGVATSAVVVNNAAECEGFQILVQGNQILFISNLLTKYGIEKKYMTGLELIPKK
ncbi:Translation initiation factor SUI1 family protein [Brugia malayi]|uniref:Bm2381 n=2 Tax=Brugia TaxID=6278 RepID=A0A0K0J5P5_BRUMA|nr:Translation initiation factor SUI1 family protein [Brugia malayi]CRZ24171.1 Bm2381 [Brugia malayi]VIO94600.1 Translation initiation factor SUI1 family protein [Brugia malayi]